MESRARLLGHPIHQMLVSFPIGAFGFSVASDALHAWSGRPEHADAARLALDFGLVTGALAVPFGLVDWLAVERGTRAKRVGLWHAVGNAALLGLFASSRLLRSRGRAPRTAQGLSALGFALSGATAWLGGELIGRHGIGLQRRVGQDEPDPQFLGSPPPLFAEPVDADEVPVEWVPDSVSGEIEPPTLPGGLRAPDAGR